MNGSHIIDKPARRSLLRWIGVAAMTLGVGTASAAIQGPSAPELEVTLLHGTKASASAIPSGWPELADPPFNAYNRYEILSTKTLALKKGSPSKESLPDGSSLEATLLDDSNPKVKFELVLKDSKGAQVSKGTYSSPKGKRFLPVSTPYKTGALVVGVKVL
ncbi:MAG: hypothetical protein HYV09_00795 [Deltaproteobacteria bacterium]|nr:hypothetical protein [Deltaproteobacteria bacterium]